MKAFLVAAFTSIFWSLFLSSGHAQQNSVASTNVVAAVNSWLKLPRKDRPEFESQPFATESLDKLDAKKITSALWADHQEFLKRSRIIEWNDKTIKLNDLEMKFEYRVFGDKPKDGRSLFISMHGGGGTAARVNDGQWRNQIRLYEPDEGVYLAPRAPNDAWNMWHQSHIDKFFDRIIQDAVLFEGVNPNKVYLMGYSAGGDGVYQLAPRMADSFAAAAMMAGHPNDASPLGLRNIGFTIHMGGKDKAYNRNKIAAQWKTRLSDLQNSDPSGYRHKVVIHKEMGHWMRRKDAVAVNWMTKFKRDSLPTKVVWHQDDVPHQNFYWLSVPVGQERNRSLAVVQRKGNQFRLIKINGIKQLQIQLNDEMIDFSKPIEVIADGKTSTFNAERTPAAIYKSIGRRSDRNLIFSSQVSVDIDAKDSIPEKSGQPIE